MRYVQFDLLFFSLKSNSTQKGIRYQGQDYVSKEYSALFHSLMGKGLFHRWPIHYVNEPIGQGVGARVEELQTGTCYLRPLLPQMEQAPS